MPDRTDRLALSLACYSLTVTGFALTMAHVWPWWGILVSLIPACIPLTLDDPEA